MDEHNDPLIDTAIDDVASAMTSASPDGRLAERVSLALRERSASKGRAWIVAPIAAAAIVLMAVAVMRERTATPSNVVRLLAGLPLGAAAGWVIARSVR